MNQEQRAAFNKYRGEIRKLRVTNRTTEHSYRPALTTLINSLSDQDTTTINESSRIECGAPDLCVLKDEFPLGYIECKDYDAKLKNWENDEQILRYRNGLPNLILTNYLEFRWYSNGELNYPPVRIMEAQGIARGVPSGDDQAVLDLLTDHFFAAEIQRIDSAEILASRMAAKTSLLCDIIVNIMKSSEPSRALQDLLQYYRDELIDDLSIEEFANIQAQTAVYGLFAARFQHNEESGNFSRMNALWNMASPFLGHVLNKFAGRDAEPRIVWLLSDIVHLLNNTNMESIRQSFGAGINHEDPVIYFYEDFLAKYDRKTRLQKGVFYTPEPIVSYIVRSVDHLLKSKFDLQYGLADRSMIQINENGEDHEVHRVQILDPAAGTGTFLCETIKTVRSTIEKLRHGRWQDYVENHLLPRLFGFEILMSAYVICHLKLVQTIRGENDDFVLPSDRRINVFLTNSLERARNIHEEILGDQLVRELQFASKVKNKIPVMVVIGNPPYSIDSANNGEWITGLMRGKEGTIRTENYYEVNGKPLDERNPKPLNDDYVKFIRFAQWKIDRTGEGIFAFITNHSYLDNITFPGMRQSLLNSFDEIYILDLHGGIDKGERTPEGKVDSNVFEITQGVAIGIFVKHRPNSSDEEKKPAKVFHSELWDDDKKLKLNWLAEHNFQTTNWNQIYPQSPHYNLLPYDVSAEIKKEFQDGWSVLEIFSDHLSGIKFGRSNFTVQFSKEEMKRVTEDFVNLETEVAREYYELGKDTDWKVHLAQRDLMPEPDATKIKEVMYKPFDFRYTYYTDTSNGFLSRPRHEIMQHMLDGNNLGLVTVRQVAEGIFNHAVATQFIISERSTVSKRGAAFLFPLRLKQTSIGNNGKMQTKFVPNLNEEFTQILAKIIGLKFETEGDGDLENSFGADNVFHYIYAVLHCAGYRNRYEELLTYEFPRIPFTSDRELFSKLVGHGKTLVDLHLMKTHKNDIVGIEYAEMNKFLVEDLKFDKKNNRVYINKNKVQYFDGVSEDIWNFAIGGYKPVQGWLKERKNCDLDYNDSEHFCKMCAAISETIGTMALIEESIDNHGGWPLNGENNSQETAIE